MSAVSALCFASLASLWGCETPADRVAALTRARDFAGLLELAASPDTDVACKALNAITWARGVDAVDAHLAALQHDRCGWEPRAEAGFRLAEELPADQRTRAVGPVAALLAVEPRELRWNAARVLGNLQDVAALPALEACAADPDPFVAAWCVWARCKVETSGGDCKRPNMNLTNGKPAP